MSAIARIEADAVLVGFGPDGVPTLALVGESGSAVCDLAVDEIDRVIALLAALRDARANPRREGAPHAHQTAPEGC